MPHSPEQPQSQPQSEQPLEGIAFTPDGAVSTDHEVLYQSILNTELDQTETEARIQTLLSAIDGNKVKMLEAGISHGAIETLEAANKRNEMELIDLRLHLEQLEDKLEEDIPKWPKPEKLN